MLFRLAATVALAVLIVNVVSVAAMEETGHSHVVGGVGSLRQKDNDAQQAVDSILPELEQKAGKKYKSVEVLSYKSQVVAGRNYFVKAKATTQNDLVEILHLRIYQPLRGNMTLHQVQFNKTEKDELKYFQ